MINATLLLLLSTQVPTDALHRFVVLMPAETVHVVISGAGEPVVLVPGLLGGSFGFRKVVALLNQAGFRTHVVELLGTGRSSQPRRSDYTLEAQAARITAVMDSLKIPGSIVVAHAIGGSVAARMAARRPDLIDGLVLLEGGAAESATTPGLQRALKLAPLIRLFGVGKMRGRIRDQLIAASGDPAWVEAAVVDEYTADAARDFGATLRALQAMGAAREPDSIAGRLPSIRVPVLLLVGGSPHTGGPPAAEIELMTRSLPYFASDTLSGVGHFLQEEAPESVSRAVLGLRWTRLSISKSLPTR